MPFSHTVRRIACLQPSATVILDAVGEIERVVACTRYCADVVPAVADGSRLVLADSWTADTAQILEARPDLVIAAVPYQEKAVSEILKAGARFLGLAPKTLADIYTDIATIAGAVGATDRGAELISSMQSTLREVSTRTADTARPRVWCEEWGKPVIASQTWVAELVATAGGEFVGAAGRQTSAEQVRQPVGDEEGVGDRVGPQHRRDQHVAREAQDAAGHGPAADGEDTAEHAPLLSQRGARRHVESADPESRTGWAAANMAASAATNSHRS